MVDTTTSIETEKYVTVGDDNMPKKAMDEYGSYSATSTVETRDRRSRGYEVPLRSLSTRATLKVNKS